MEYSYIINGKEFRAHCSEIYQEQIIALFEKFTELDSNGPNIVHGSIIEFGWSRLTVKDFEGRLIVHEPDFDGNPIKDTVPSVEQTLRIAHLQAVCANRLKVKSETCRFNEKAIIVKGILKKDSIYFERKEKLDKSDSGWFIGDFQETNSKDRVDKYETIYTYELLKLRSELIPYLALPVGYLVVCSKNEIIQIFNPEGEDILA